MLRIAIRRVFLAALRGEEADLAGNWMEALDKLGLASSRLAGLLRTQRALSGSAADQVEAALKQALAEIAKELKLE